MFLSESVATKFLTPFLRAAFPNTHSQILLVVLSTSAANYLPSLGCPQLQQAYNSGAALLTLNIILRSEWAGERS